jgi:hypothetical protein
MREQARSTSALGFFIDGGNRRKTFHSSAANARGEICHVIELRDCAAKKKSGRLIPTALAAWRKLTTGSGADRVARRETAATAPSQHFVGNAVDLFQRAD